MYDANVADQRNPTGRRPPILPLPAPPEADDTNTAQRARPRARPPTKDVTSELPRFNFFDMAAPIFTRPRFLPGSKINGAHIEHAVISDGCILNHARITNCIVGIRSLVGAGTELNRVILLGCDYYESNESIKANEAAGRPRVGIGMNCRIENAIIDKNSRIGNNVVISPSGKPENADHPLYYIRDGIVIIPKNGVVPHGTVI